MCGIIFAVFIVLAIVSGVWGIYRAAKNKRLQDAGMQAAARQLGWQYAPQGFNQLLPYLNGINQSRGDSRFVLANVSNVITGTIENQRVAVFDHYFVDKSGSTSTTYYETLFLIVSDKLDLPNFHAQKEGWLDSFFNDLFDRPDIKLPHRPDFSKQYLLRGHNQIGVQQVFTNAVVNFYLQHYPLETIGGGNCLCLFHNREHNAPLNDNEIKGWLQTLTQLHGLLARR